MSEDNFLEKLQNCLKDYLVDAKKKGDRLYISKVKAEAVDKVVKALKESFGDIHVTTISAVDYIEYLEVFYDLWLHGPKVALVLKAKVNPDRPELPSIVGVIPGALFNECEVYDLFGIIFKGNNHLKKSFILPEHFPKDYFPLRKKR
ncbi:MAG TPA: NADH-quinone oxidoreductase subunit C [Thermoprotei archaeon]|nr:NADH-quinone oxidoreductase subunit C [Thermoprotei archaeon]